MSDVIDPLKKLFSRAPVVSTPDAPRHHALLEQIDELLTDSQRAFVETSDAAAQRSWVAGARELSARAAESGYRIEAKELDDALNSLEATAAAANWPRESPNEESKRNAGGVPLAVPAAGIHREPYGVTACSRACRVLYDLRRVIVIARFKRQHDDLIEDMERRALTGMARNAWPIVVAAIALFSGGVFQFYNVKMQVGDFVAAERDKLESKIKALDTGIEQQSQKLREAEGSAQALVNQVQHSSADFKAEVQRSIGEEAQKRGKLFDDELELLVRAQREHLTSEVTRIAAEFQPQAQQALQHQLEDRLEWQGRETEKIERLRKEAADLSERLDSALAAEKELRAAKNELHVDKKEVENLSTQIKELKDSVPLAHLVDGFARWWWLVIGGLAVAMLLGFGLLVRLTRGGSKPEKTPNPAPTQATSST